MASRTMNLRKPDTCVACATPIDAGTAAFWNADAKTVTCLDCYDAEPAPIDRGVAGASARREYDRRRAARENRVREKHPHLGGVIVALQEPPKSETAWLRGERGEVAVAEVLDKRCADLGVVVLADRRIPGSRANIDLIAIAPSGVFVIDAKDWKGKLKIAHPLFGPPKLLVDGRNRTSALDGMDKQVAVVTAALEAAGLPVAVQGVMCFTQIDLPWLRSQEVRGHVLMYRKALAKKLSADGPLRPETIAGIERSLAAALPAA